MNNEVLKQTLLHYINLEYYANSIDEEYQTLLNELVKRCNAAILTNESLNTKTSYTALMTVVRKEVEEFRIELEERLEETAGEVMNNELEFLQRTYSKEESEDEKKNNKLLEGVGAVALTLGGISLAKLLFTPIDGRDTTKQFVERTGRNIARAYETSLRGGYLFGQKTDDIVSNVNKQMKQISTGMRNGIRTAIPSYAKTTDRLAFSNEEVVWVSTLDGSTCLQCAALSGTHYKSITEVPFYPVHCLCRCVLIPAALLSNPVPNFEEFLEELSEEEQKQVLGVNRYKLMKDYGVKPDKFINNGTVINYSDLDAEKLIKNAPIIKANAETAELVKQTYPNETFVRRKITENSYLYVSKKRIKEGIKDLDVYKSDKMMATQLIKETDKDLYLISEKGGPKGTKHPDGFYINSTIEMKHVRGDLDKLGKNAIDALKQANYTYLYCDKNFSEKASIRKIHGSVNAKRGDKRKKGEVFKEPKKDDLLYIHTNNTLYKLHWGDVL